ncbi:PleD family two-component system response regulator [Mesonia ostreae]|uniref:Response regulator n=1 Tax=Mesonia ostreae TaxID=861110 RepID=A0ABU2KL07_9FLAO|nr:response regulator [Mesonia ostreae]MDT0295413.1 response regulator [Mesonia ostreae]
MITTKLRILLVEGVVEEAELIRLHLKKIVENFELKVVDNLADTSQALQDYIPDVVLSDYVLPTCTGLEILQIIKEIDESIPFIFITGSIEDEELAENTILAGTSGYVLKKHMDVLSEKLKPLLKRVAFDMFEKADLRDKIRKNKITVNQIYSYIDHMNSDNEEQKKNIYKIRKNIKQVKDKED